MNYIYRFSLGFLFGCRGQRPIPKTIVLKSNELLRIFSKDVCLGLLLTAHSDNSLDSWYSCSFKIFNQNPDQNALEYLA